MRLTGPRAATPPDRQEPNFQPAKGGEFSTGADTRRALGRALREIIAEAEREWAERLGHEHLEALRSLLTELCNLAEPKSSA